MRLKKIKPGTVICCKNNAEWNELEDHFENMGWDERDYIRRLDHSTVIHIDGFNEVRWENKSNIVNGSDITYFSDLVIPELSAAEVLRICNEICATRKNGNCSTCKMYHNCFFDVSSDYQKVVEVCEQWKADHEKKEPEFEWIWEGRIYEIHDNNKGNFYQLDDGNGFYDTGCTCQESAEDYMTDVLKDYCSTHEGEYIAIVDRVCRVKQ